jgi:hypothetical protein
MIAIAHLKVLISIPTLFIAIEYTNYLVIKIQFVIRWVLVVLDTAYLFWSDMRSESGL